MSRKHHCRHQRSVSHYPERLKRRGVTNVDVRMEDLETLRRRAGRSARPEPLPGVAYDGAAL